MRRDQSLWATCPTQTDEASLRQHFVQGCSLANEDIENVRIVRDKLTQQCKGFGYILFTTKTMATTALQRMHETTYKKRNLRVTVCGKRFKGRKGDPSRRKRRQNRSMQQVLSREFW
jgi:nucleolar protein 12